jgi:hypothetical protein
LLKAPDNPDRRKFLSSAIAELRPIVGASGIAFAIAEIERMLNWRRYVMNTSPPLPSTGATQLRALVKALRKLREAAENLNEPAREELNAAKNRLGLQWCSPGAWSFGWPGELGDFLDWGYPSLMEVAEEAAKQLDRQKRKKGGRPAQRDQYLSALAVHVAALYEVLTGKEPPRSRSENRFTNFLGAIFAAGDVKGEARHYGSIGANLYHLAKETGAKPPEISWVMRLD